MFRLLGSFGFWRDGREVDLGPARQRSVLAVLLVHLGQPMPTPGLIDRVWGDQPPRRAREVLYTYLSRLRGVLAGASVSLCRQRGGYLCVVDGTLVDLAEFARLTAQAAGERNATARLRLLRRASNLWQGEPLGGLDGDWIQRTRDRLHQQWLSVVIDRVKLEMDLGQHATLVTELSDVVSAHPAVEPLVGQLMVALHRCGRHTEALEVFRRTRALMIEQLGLEPGPELQRLEYAILTNAPELGLRPVAVAGPTRPASTRFTGRRTVPSRAR